MANTTEAGGRIAANVRAAAGAASIPQIQIAKHLHITRPAVGRRWNGSIEWSGAELVLLAELLDVDPRDLITVTP